MQNEKTKAIFLPGNGGGTTSDSWFPYVGKELEKLGIKVIASDFPDPILARKKYWLPFLEKLGTDENTILIGHSSGGVAAMRYAENHQILGSILVGVNHTDLGIVSEKISGYYSSPWQWQNIRNNQQWIALFASSDDPWIPIEEPQFIAKKLKPDYFEYVNEGHFGGDREKLEFPEIVQYIKKKLF